MIKKVFYLILLVSTGMMFCKTTTTDTLLEGNTKTYKSEGWLDDDTFQVKAIGAPHPDAEGKVKRKTQSKQAALLAAQARIIELMIGSRIQSATASLDGESTGVAVSKEFEGMLKGGEVVQETYDSEDNCELIYRIYRKGLKKRAETEIERLQ